jgi:hypothetical protein
MSTRQLHKQQCQRLLLFFRGLDYFFLCEVFGSCFKDELISKKILVSEQQIESVYKASLRQAKDGS